MPGSQDLDMPVEGVRPRPGGPDMTETNITRLFTVAAMVTDDLAKQVEIVSLALIARMDHNDLRRRIGALVVPDRPVRPYVAPITPRRPSARTIR